MRPIVPENAENQRSADAMTATRSRGALEPLTDFGNEKPNPSKEKQYNWDHALVASDEASCDGQTENHFGKPGKKTVRNMNKKGHKSCDATAFTTLSEIMEDHSSVGSGTEDDDSDNESHITSDSNRAKLVDARLMRIAEEHDHDIVFETSFNSPTAISINRMGSSSSSQINTASKTGNRHAYSDDHTELATDIAGNLSSSQAKRDRDDAASLFSWPASDINSNLTPTNMKQSDNMDLMSFFSEPATEIMGNLTSAGLRKNRTTESSLQGEQFLSEIETHDDESLFSEEGKGAQKKEIEPKSTKLVPDTPRISNIGVNEAVIHTADERMQNLMCASGSKANTTLGNIKNKTTGGSKDDKAPPKQEQANLRETVVKTQNLTLPNGSDDDTIRTSSVDQLAMVQKIPQSVCVGFVICALLAFVAAVVFIVVGLPTLMNDSEASSSRNVAANERAKVIWDLAVLLSGTEPMKDESSPAYKAYDWLLRSDSYQVMETSSETLAERFVVVLLYFATSGGTWKEKHNFLSNKSICTWNDSDENHGLTLGVSCDIKKRAKQIILVDNNLQGSIPIEISGLDHLEILNLSQNFLDSDIPQELGEMKSLLDLNFMSNKFEGTIPSSLGKLATIVSLDLSSNKLTGSLPTELGNLRDLERLSLGNNKLEGTIPESFENMENLTDMNLFRNAFHGDIPSGVAALPFLTTLNLASNHFAGDFGEGFCEASRAYDSFWADCRGESPVVQCSCCTICCQGDGEYLECY